jgi:pimeloyl-[acyl-carrier protein] synthase
MPVRFNPFDGDFRRDPYPVYHALRAEAPVHRSFLDAWVLTRHADVKMVLRDRRFGVDPIPARIAERHRFLASRGGSLEALMTASQRFFFFLDPPAHTRLRGLVTSVFSPGAVQRMVPILTAYIDRLLDDLDARETFDLIDDYAAPLPVFVIASMLGVQDADLRKLNDWSLELSRILDPLVSLEEYQEMDGIVRGFEACFREVFAARRAQPADDIISTLLAGAAGHDDLQERDLAAICTLLFITGEETTVNLIGNGVLSLQRQPGAWTTLGEEPGLMGTAVDELLRFESPVQLTTRVAHEDAEIGDVPIRAGEKIVVGLGAANRDPEVFEAPDELRLDRQPNPHVAFGDGIHFCLGATLARTQGRLAIARLIERFPGLRVEDTDLQWRRNIVVRGLQHLKVRA